MGYYAEKKHNRKETEIARFAKLLQFCHVLEPAALPCVFQQGHGTGGQDVTQWEERSTFRVSTRHAIERDVCFETYGLQRLLNIPPVI